MLTNVGHLKKQKNQIKLVGVSTHCRRRLHVDVQFDGTNYLLKFAVPLLSLCFDLVSKLTSLTKLTHHSLPLSGCISGQRP